MATHTVTGAQVGVHNIAMAANVETIVQFEQDISTVEIINLDGAAAVYFTVNEEAAVVAGPRTQVLPATINAVRYEPVESTATRVSLISAGTPKISVTRA